MKSIDLIRDNLRNSRDRVLAHIEDMRGHAVVSPTPNGGGHTLWVLGHLAYIEGLVIHQFMLGDVNPLADWEETFDGAGTSPEVNDYPPFDDVLAECRAIRELTIELLDNLTEDDLDRSGAAVPDGTESIFGTYRQCFQYVADHWYMHRGNLADARRAAGVVRMWV